MRYNCPHLATNESHLISSRALKIYCKLKSSYDGALRNQGPEDHYFDHNLETITPSVMMKFRGNEYFRASPSPPPRFSKKKIECFMHNTENPCAYRLNTFKNCTDRFKSNNTGGPVHIRLTRSPSFVSCSSPSNESGASSSSSLSSTSLTHPSEFDHGSYCRKKETAHRIEGEYKVCASTIGCEIVPEKNCDDSLQTKKLKSPSPTYPSIAEAPLFKSSTIAHSNISSEILAHSNSGTDQVKCVIHAPNDSSAVRSQRIQARDTRYSHIVSTNSKKIKKGGGYFEDRMDTVGAIAVDYNNNIACAISSGGIHLKAQGRIGQAAMAGAGCWAVDNIAVATSGVGEFITSSLLARQLHSYITQAQIKTDLKVEVKSDHKEPACLRPDFEHEEIQSINQQLKKCLDNEFVGNPALAHVDPAGRMSGFLAITLKNPHKLLLSFGHNTNQMCIGYMSNKDDEANSIVSSRDENTFCQSFESSVKSQSIIDDGIGAHCVKSMEISLV